jgi:GntR family transcriptional regulator, transcriptional repressor for pyruvate dehydrogenase complex
MSIIPVERRRLSDAVVEQLTELIGSSAFAVGSKLPSERELARSFGVSRTLVRESIRILESSGIIEVKPGVGAIVTAQHPVTADIKSFLQSHAAQVLEVVEVRETLVVRATELAATRITDPELDQLRSILAAQREALQQDSVNELVALDNEFHQRVYNAARNSVLLAVEEYTRTVLNNVRWNVLTLSSRRAEALAEHERIFDALHARDAAAAAAAARLHAERSNREIRRFALEREGADESATAAPAHPLTGWGD